MRPYKSEKAMEDIICQWIFCATRALRDRDTDTTSATIYKQYINCISDVLDISPTEVEKLVSTITDSEIYAHEIPAFLD